VSTGFYEHKRIAQRYPKPQLRTVNELMEGNPSVLSRLFLASESA
jgi:hypothetical protein